MDFLALLRTLFSHKLVVLGVLIATVAGMAFVLFGMPPLYKQTSSVVILQPRYAPSKADLEKSPELASVDSYNPFSGDPSLIVGVVSSRLSSDATRESFLAKGLDPNFEVAGALSYGAARPELLITAFGSSAKQVSETRAALTRAVEAQLTAVQREQGVAEYYMVGALPVEPTTPPKLQTSGSVRSALAVGLLGAIVLFALISALTALISTGPSVPPDLRVGRSSATRAHRGAGDPGVSKSKAQRGGTSRAEPWPRRLRQIGPACL